MNVLFLSLLDFETLDEHNIYTDLLRVFCKNSHKIYAISPVERRKNQKTILVDEEATKILKLSIGNITKCNIIEKGISTLSIERLYIMAIKKYFGDVKFDLVLYSTPPITFCNVVKFVKERDGAKSYLLLKDIFPQNAVDMALLKNTGIKGCIYRYFKCKERMLYEISDYIGCMSKANVDYILQHNSYLNPPKVHVCPNSIEIDKEPFSDEERRRIRDKYDLPHNKKILIYGGNLGKPQGIPFMIKCVEAEMDNEEVFFLIVGDGTEYDKIESFVSRRKPKNLKIIKRLPKEDYDNIVFSCDVGLIFLDNRFTIPNFPSRLLSYMQASLPVIACTDKNTDIGEIITNNEFGWWCESSEVEDFSKIIDEVCGADLKTKGKNSLEYLRSNYDSDRTYHIIMNAII